MSGAPQVVKYGGAAMQAPAARAAVAAALRTLRADGGTPYVVHGGGPAIGQALAAAGLEARFVDGRRVTSERALPVVEASLTLLGKRIAQEIGDAVALTGRDAGLLRGEPIEADLGRVGRVTHVDVARLTALAGIDLTPVLACLALAPDDELLNVNGDEAAGAVAAALGAPVTFLTDVPGVLDTPGGDGPPLASVSAADAEARLADGRIAGGMVPKVRAALEALARGAPSARIAAADDAATVLAALRGTGGTALTP